MHTVPYFVTICTYNQECLFGYIDYSGMQINNYGNCVLKCWYDLPNHYPYIQLDEFVVMPNHVHGIIIITEEPRVGAGLKPALVRKNRNAASKRAGLKPAPTRENTNKRHTLSEIVRAIKTFTSREINRMRKCTGISVWQRNYYEHIIRNDIDLNEIRQYIINNPSRWNDDRNHPDNLA